MPHKTGKKPFFLGGTLPNGKKAVLPGGDRRKKAPPDAGKIRKATRRALLR